VVHQATVVAQWAHKVGGNSPCSLVSAANAGAHIVQCNVNDL